MIPPSAYLLPCKQIPEGFVLLALSIWMENFVKAGGVGSYSISFKEMDVF
jgi:hypothetical protein